MVANAEAQRNHQLSCLVATSCLHHQMQKTGAMLPNALQQLAHAICSTRYCCVTVRSVNLNSDKQEPSQPLL